MKTTRAPLVASLVGAGLIVLTLVGLIMPKASAVRSKQREVVKAQQQEQQLRVQLAQLQDDARHAGASTRKLQVLEREVPTTADLPGIIRSLNNSALLSGLTFVSVSPAQPTLSADSKYSVVPVGITLAGDYWAVDQFLYRLESMQRVVTVGTLSLTNQKSTTGTSTTSTTTTTSPATQGELQITLAASFFTTDLSAGPGSIPGPTAQLPTTSTTPGTTTTTSGSSTTTGSNGGA